jgi:hypothetical protein
MRLEFRNKFNFHKSLENSFDSPQGSRSFPVDAAVLYGGEVLPGSAIKETPHTCDIAMV